MLRLVVLFVFCLLGAGSFTLYSIVFGQVGSPRISTDYIVSLVLNPLFLFALGLSLFGAVLRMFIFKEFGISRSAVLSELTFLFTLSGGLLVSHEKVDLKLVVGALLMFMALFVLES